MSKLLQKYLRKGLYVGVLLTLANIALVLADLSAPSFDGAPRDEEGRFTNPGDELVHGSLEVRLPFMLRRMGTYFRAGTDAPERIANDGVFLRENAQQGVPTVTWIGHATLLVQMDDVTFLTDPTWSNRPSPVPLLGPKRFVKPGIAIADLPPIDFVVISHNHYDHLDLPTLKKLAKRDANTKFYVPLGNGDLLRKADITDVHELDWGQTVNFGSIVIHCLPARHWSKRSINDDNKSLWSSWAITGAEKRFYFSGDTGYFPGFEDIGNKLGPFDLVAVPIGAYEPVAMMRESHMNPEEAIAAALDLQAKKAIAIHYGTFDLSDEPLAEPPKRFLEAAKPTALGDNGAWVVKVGETRKF